MAEDIEALADAIEDAEPADPGPLADGGKTRNLFDEADQRLGGTAPKTPPKPNAKAEAEAVVESEAETPPGGEPSGAAAVPKSIHEELELGDDYKELQGDDLVRRLHKDRRELEAAREQELARAVKYAKDQIYQDPRWQQFLKSQQAAITKPAEPEKPWLDDLVEDPLWNKWLAPELDAQGQPTDEIVFKKDTPDEIIKAVGAYRAAHAKFIQSVSNPKSFRELIDRAVAHHFDRRIPEETKKAIEQYQRDQDYQRLSDENADWLYLKDESNRFVVDEDGNPQWSPLGIEVLQEAQRLMQKGYRDDKVAFIDAMERVEQRYQIEDLGRKVALPAPKQEQAKPPTKTERNMATLRKVATSTVGRGGSRPDVDHPRKPRQSETISDEDELWDALLETTGHALN